MRQGSLTIFAGYHQPLQKWVGCLYLMGLNLSSEQIAAELDLHKDDAYQMTMQLRQGIVDNKPEVQLSGMVEFDEVYVTAGHKGQPKVVTKRGEKGAGTSSKGFGVGAPLSKRSPRLRHDPTGWGGGDSDARQCAAGDD